MEVHIPMAGGAIAGCWYGDVTRRPLVALHGWQDNAGSFARLAPLLAVHVPVLAIDFPGHGRSFHYPAGIRYHTVDYLTVILHIMRYYKWRKISLLGHSMGGALSFLFSSLAPGLVDTVVALDVLVMRNVTSEIQINSLREGYEKGSILDERLLKSICVEPPNYTHDKLEEILHVSSGRSVNLENCKYLLERSTTPSARKPGTYYVSRDSRVKVIWDFFLEPQFRLVLAKRIRNINYLVIRMENSRLVTNEVTAIIDIMRANNPHFEIHSLPNATHHLHLNQPDDVAALILPFLQKYYTVEDLPAPIT